MNKEDKILEILNEHTKTLEQHTKILNQHTKILEQHTKILDEHTKKLEQHDKILNEHTKRLDEYSKRFENIERSLLLIEDAVTTKIPALFDAHSFHQDHLERHDNEIKDLQSKTENHALRLIVLEDDLKNHSKQIKHLSSTN